MSESGKFCPSRTFKVTASFPLTCICHCFGFSLAFVGYGNEGSLKRTKLSWQLRAICQQQSQHCGNWRSILPTHFTQDVEEVSNHPALSKRIELLLAAAKELLLSEVS